ncbi:MAG TPA: glycerol-3-phosphate 1-O-acyltransferase PlsY [Gammaproteobacteria bacterium]
MTTMFELNATFFILVASAYLLGSLSTAIIVCKLMGLPDPRTTGSQNPGATNVLRIGGKTAAAITLAGDALKGFLPVLIGYAFQQSPANLGIIGFAAFLGHLYPVFFSFRGGKGVATAFGVILAISWPVGLAVLATWLIMAKLFKISSLSALTAAGLAPVYFWFFEANLPLLIIAIAMSAMLIYRHRSNIRNLIKGTENTIR